MVSVRSGGQANYEERPNVSQAPGDHQAQKILQEETAHQTQIPLVSIPRCRGRICEKRIPCRDKSDVIGSS